MRGSAVTTTRVSSATMKYATEVSSTVRTPAEVPGFGCLARAAATCVAIDLLLRSVRPPCGPALDQVDPGRPANEAASERPVSALDGVSTVSGLRGWARRPEVPGEEVMRGCDHGYGSDRPRPGRGRAGLPPARRALPARTRGALLSHPGVGAGCRGRDAGDPARGVAEPRRLRAAQFASHLAVP